MNRIADNRTRLFNWKVSLFVLLAIILVIVPLAATLMIVVGVGGWSASMHMLLFSFILENVRI